MSAGERHGDLVVVADPHVGADDPDLPAFLAWLAARAEDAGTVVLLGDLFSLWLGLDRWTRGHHREVLSACAGLRRAGVRVVLVEGNRELWAAPWEGRAFDTVARAWRRVDGAGRRWLFVHGDLLDREDVANRLFQAVVRSTATRAAFRLLPAGVAPAFGQRLERLLRRRYRRRRQAPPEDRLSALARELGARGADAVAIGHYHVERRRPAAAGDAELWLVPDWRGRRRYLRIPREGEPRYEEAGPPPPPAPRILGAAPGPGELVRLEVEGPLFLRAGAPVAVDGGEGPEVLRGRVVSVDDPGGEARPARVRVHLAEGPRVRPGDRLRLPDEEVRRGP